MKPAGQWSRYGTRRRRIELTVWSTTQKTTEDTESTEVIITLVALDTELPLAKDAKIAKAGWA